MLPHWIALIPVVGEVAMVPSRKDKSRPLERIRRLYSVWGRHPWLYAAQDWVSFLGQHRTIRREAAAALGVGPGASVLEVGCGTGRNFPYIEAVIGPEGTLTGVDATPAMLAAAADLARTHGWENVPLRLADAADLPPPGKPYDAVLFAFSLSVIPDHKAALRRAWEQLKPGGRLVVCDARLPGDPHGLVASLLKAIYEPLAGWHGDRDLMASMATLGGRVSSTWFNADTVFIASMGKPVAKTPAKPSTPASGTQRTSSPSIAGDAKA